MNQELQASRKDINKWQFNTRQKHARIFTCPVALKTFFLRERVQTAFKNLLTISYSEALAENYLEHILNSNQILMTLIPELATADTQKQLNFQLPAWPYLWAKTAEFRDITQLMFMRSNGGKR